MRAAVELMAYGVVRLNGDTWIFPVEPEMYSAAMPTCSKHLPSYTSQRSQRCIMKLMRWKRAWGVHERLCLLYGDLASSSVPRVQNHRPERSADAAWDARCAEHYSLR